MAQKQPSRVHEFFRKLLVSLKRKPSTIPLVVLALAFVYYSFNLSSISNTTALINGPHMGLSGFAVMLFSALGLVCFLNSFPHRKKPNIPMLVLSFLMMALLVCCDLYYNGRIVAALTRAESPISPTGKNAFVTVAQHVVHAHMILVIISAALTALALFVSYADQVQLASIDILTPNVVIGLLIGGMLPFAFSAMTMDSVSKAAYKMIEEVRRQFREIPGILEGTGRPDYASCVSISTRSALHEMVAPGLMAVLVPLLVGILLGPAALGGLLAGSLVTGVLLAIYMSNAGGAWDNAKKYIEGGAHGGKGSEAHKAAVVGDTVGDPFKDTSGPSINILIKLMTIVSLVFAPIFLKIGGIL